MQSFARAVAHGTALTAAALCARCSGRSASRSRVTASTRTTAARAARRRHRRRSCRRRYKRRLWSPRGTATTATPRRPQPHALVVIGRAVVFVLLLRRLRRLRRRAPAAQRRAGWRQVESGGWVTPSSTTRKTTGSRRSRSTPHGVVRPADDRPCRRSPVASKPRRAGTRLPPHRIPHKANVWRCTVLGVRSIVASCAAACRRAHPSR